MIFQPLRYSTAWYFFKDGLYICPVMAKTHQEKILLGLKIRQLRQEHGWNFDDLSKQTGISVSYLNEIEKGKKYPQPENRAKLAAALGVAPEYLTDGSLGKQFAPLADLLRSNFLNELPLDLFGIELQQLVEIIARAPDRVNAFISAILEIARNYSLREENFFFAALRAYQELRNNYFDEIETVIEQFVQQHQLPADGGVPENLLARLLIAEYGYKIDDQSLSQYPELQELRSLYHPGKRKLLLNNRLNERQRAFQLAKELGFATLKLRERGATAALPRVGSFEEVLNNYKAAYFAVGILVNRHAFVRDIAVFFQQNTWQSDTLLALMDKYQASPEVLFQRFNVLTTDFRLDKVFFQRFIHDLEHDEFDIDKELHLNRRHQPHATGLHEHYCRRWLSLRMLDELRSVMHSGIRLISGVQRASFLNTGEEYLCIAVAKTGFPNIGKNVSVTLGVLLDEQAKKTIRFWNDPAIPQITVNITCQRCALKECSERAAPPDFVMKREKRKKMQELIRKLTENK